MSLTGDAKTFGTQAKNGIALAVAEANARGAKVTVVYVDDESDVTQGVNVANKLIVEDGVKALVGPVKSRIAVPVSEIANTNKIVEIVPTSTNPRLTVDGKRKEYVFRACLVDPFQGTVMAKLALENLKSKKAAVLYDKGGEYSKGIADSFRAAYSAGGGRIDTFESYGEPDTDFSPLLAKVAASNPDFLFLPDYYGKVSLIAKQARAKGIAALFGGPDGWAAPELDFAATDGGYFSYPYSAADPRPEVQSFVRAYRAAYGVEADAIAALGYDAASLLLTAAERAGSDDPAAVRAQLAGLRRVATVTGALTFDRNGNPIKDAVIMQVKNGGAQYATTVRADDGMED